MPHTVTRGTDNPAQARAVDGRTGCRQTVPALPATPSQEVTMAARPSTARRRRR